MSDCRAIVWLFEVSHDVINEIKIATRLHWNPENTELEIQSLCLEIIQKASPFVWKTGINVGINAAKRNNTNYFKKNDLKENLVCNLNKPIFSQTIILQTEVKKLNLGTTFLEILARFSDPSLVFNVIHSINEVIVIILVY